MSNDLQLMMRSLERERLARKKAESQLEMREAELLDRHHELTKVVSIMRGQMEMLEEAVNAMTLAIVSVDVDGSVRLFNRHAQKMFGMAAEEVLGTSFRSMMPEVFSIDNARRIRDDLLLGQVKSISNALGRRRDGSEIHIDVNCTVNVRKEQRRITLIMTRPDRAEEKTQEIESAKGALPVNPEQSVANQQDLVNFLAEYEQLRQQRNTELTVNSLMSRIDRMVSDLITARFDSGPQEEFKYHKLPAPDNVPEATMEEATDSGEARNEDAPEANAECCSAAEESTSIEVEDVSECSANHAGAADQAATSTTDAVQHETALSENEKSNCEPTEYEASAAQDTPLPEEDTAAEQATGASEVPLPGNCMALAHGNAMPEPPGAEFITLEPSTPSQQPVAMPTDEVSHPCEIGDPQSVTDENCETPAEEPELPATAASDGDTCAVSATPISFDPPIGCTRETVEWPLPDSADSAVTTIAKETGDDVEPFEPQEPTPEEELFAALEPSETSAEPEPPQDRLTESTDLHEPEHESQIEAEPQRAKRVVNAYTQTQSRAIRKQTKIADLIRDGISAAEERWSTFADLVADMDELPRWDGDRKALPQIIRKALYVCSASIEEAINQQSLDRGTIRLSAREENGQVKIEISDDGVGLMPIIQKTIPALVAHETEMNIQEGLTECQNLMSSAYGGDFSVKMTLNAGTTFEITFSADP